MDGRGLAAGACLLLAVPAGCAVGVPGADAIAETPANEAPLDLSIDRVDISHGALRIAATMIDGSADVWVNLGTDCGQAPNAGAEVRRVDGIVGAGFSTVSRFTWTFGEAEVTGAMDCGLVVRARVRAGGVYIAKAAHLSVDMRLTARDSAETSVDFAAVSASAFVRALLGRRPYTLQNQAFDPSVSVGGTELERDEDPSEQVQREIEREEQSVPEQE